jgi:dolichol-phosphate mannosyltransferase
MISLVCPVFNEEDNIDALYKRTTSALSSTHEKYEIICVDDGSSDKTLEKLCAYHAQDPCFKVISFSRNFGHQPAIMAGLSHASGDFIAIIDGDLQDPPELIQAFYDKIREGFDIVYAVRKKRKEGILKRFAYWAYYRTLKSLANIEIPLDSGDFSMMSREALDHILQLREQSLFIRGLRSWVGFRQAGIEYERDERIAGAPKFTLRKLMLLAYNGIFSFSSLPIKLLSRIGLAMILFAIIYIIINLVKKYFFGDVPEGFISIIIFITLFSGIQLMALGLLGEYMSRIYDESRNRPLYIIRKKML